LPPFTRLNQQLETEHNAKLTLQSVENPWTLFLYRSRQTSACPPARRSHPDVDAPELLEVLRKVEKRGAIETARRLRQICGQVFRYAIAIGIAKYDPSAALKGALSSPGRPRGHKAMPLNEVPTFLRLLEAYDGDVRCPHSRITVSTVVRS
jgi:integrase